MTEGFTQGTFNAQPVGSKVLKLHNGIVLELPLDVEATPAGLRAEAERWEKKPPGFPEWAAELRKAADAIEAHGAESETVPDVSAELQKAGKEFGAFVGKLVNDTAAEARKQIMAQVQGTPDPMPTPTLRTAHTQEQAAPIPNASRPVWELVVEDMKARDHFGRERYGTPLQANNGRDALTDAYQEALDLSVYLRTAIEERNTGNRAAADVTEREKLRAMACARAVVMKYIRHRMPEHSSVANEVWRLIESGADPRTEPGWDDKLPAAVGQAERDDERDVIIQWLGELVASMKTGHRSAGAVTEAVMSVCEGLKVNAHRLRQTR